MVTHTICLAMFLLVLPLVCSAEHRSLTRSIDPIEVSGFEVSDITNTDISNLRVLASRDGKLAPIPFQIDQKNSDDDWVWSVVPESDVADDLFDDETSSPIYSQEDLTRDNQDPSGRDIFDANDVVLFVAKDAGDQDRESASRLGAEKLVELNIVDPADQGNGWVYLAYFDSDAPALSDIHYVRHEPDKFRVSGPEHEFLYSPDHVMVLDDFRLGGASIIAGNRIRGMVEAGIGPVTLNIEFSEQTIQGYNAGYINGPIRIIRRSIEHIRLGAGITSPDVNCDHFHYPWHAEIPILISKWLPVRQVSIQATLIYREPIFTRVEAEGIAKPILLASVFKNKNFLTANPEAKWIKLAGDEASIINSIIIPEEHKGHLEVSPYLANIKDAPYADSAIPVPGIEAGFMINTTDKTPYGNHVIHSVFLFSVDTNRKGYRANAVKLLRQKLVVNPITLAQ
jgi:hypothetical protein